MLQISRQTSVSQKTKTINGNENDSPIQTAHDVIEFCPKPITDDGPKTFGCCHPIKQGKNTHLLQSVRSVLQKIYFFKSKNTADSQTLEKIEHIFIQLHKDFDERERLLDNKLEIIEQMQLREARMMKWFSVPLIVSAFVGLGFLFYVAYSMQHSVANMSSEMSVMSGDISSMTTYTHNMSSNMSSLTASVKTMNSNIATMNQNVGSMSHSMAPIAEAAHNVNPMMGMMNSITPF